MSMVSPTRMPIGGSGPLDETTRLLGERFEFLAVLGLPGPDRYYTVSDRRGQRCTERGQTSLVLKVPSIDVAQGGAALELFLAQTRAASALEHENITRLLDSDEINGLHYCLLSFPEEFETLRGVLLRRGWLNIEDPVAYGTILQVSEALAHAHDNGVLHLLVRPEHILIDPSGDAFLTGFGLRRNDVSGPLLTELARTAAPEYISPEFRDDVPITERADLYSLGVTLYEMMTDRVPRQGRAPGRRGRSGAPLAPGVVVETVSPVVSELILRMLEDEPSKRFGGISDLRASLTAAVEPFQTAVESGAGPVDLMVPTIEVTEEGTDPIFVGEHTNTTLAQEPIGYPQVRQDRSGGESGTLTESSDTIEGNATVPVLPDLPLSPELWLASEAEFSDRPMEVGMGQHEGSLSKDNIADLREQIIIRGAGNANAHRAQGLVTFRQVDQSSGTGMLFLLAAGLVVLVFAAVLIATQQITGRRKSESSLSTEQIQAHATVANQPGALNQSGGQQNEVVRSEKRLG